MFQYLWPLFTAQLSLSLLLITSPIVDSRLHQNKDSLRDALDVLVRKQRSLDASSQQSHNYYNSLRPITYSDESIMDEDDENDDDLDFISMNNPNQLDDINGNDFQRINDIRLVMDSLRDLKSRLKTETPQHENEQSLFRERERIGSQKRDTEHMNGENYDHEDLAELFLDALRNSPPYNDDDIDDMDEYPGVRVIPANDLSIEMFQPSIYDKYKNDLIDRMSIDNGRRSLADLLPSSARQMAMEHYPISREYKNSIKRFPIAKRSGNTMKLNDIKSHENTDPKVAQDLKSLFGTRTMSEENLTVSPNNRDHNDHKMEHNHERTSVEKVTRIDSTSDYPATGTTVLNNGGQNEIGPTIVASLNNPKDNMKINKSKIKKSVDWSQYFGIDRRRKKTELLARPGTQQQDDEWLLQQNYKTIADNLRKNHFSLLSNENKTKSDNGGGGGEKRDKLEQMDERLKNVMNLIMKDAAKYSMSDNDPEANSQEVKDVIMARLAAAYSLEKMRLALNDFKNSITLERPGATSQNSAKYKNNNTSNKSMNQEKRTYINNNGMAHSTGYHYDEMLDSESLAECPELSRIEASCKPVQRRVGFSLFVPCVMYKICKLCDDKRVCATEYLREATRICDNYNDGTVEDAAELHKQCTQIASMILRMPVPRIITDTPTCYDGTLVNSCLRHYQQYKNPMRHHNINDIINDDSDSASEQRWI